MIVQTFIPENRAGVEATPDFLLSIHDDHGGYMTSSIMPAVAALLLTAIFYYLFRAIGARGGGAPRWFVYLVYRAPVPYALSQVIYAIDAIDIADEFASPARRSAARPAATARRTSPTSARRPSPASDRRHGRTGVPVRDAAAARAARRAC